MPNEYSARQIITLMDDDSGQEHSGPEEHIPWKEEYFMKNEMREIIILGLDTVLLLLFC